MTNQPESAAEITESVVRSFDDCPDPRLREVLQKLTCHLHAFAVDAGLTEQEWSSAVQFLTRTGQLCSPTRQEFILLSDTLGLSMLVDAINHAGSEQATESTVLGPFYVADSPWRENGDPLMDLADAEPTLVSGLVRSTSGEPLAGAVVDVWQNAGNMLYSVQDAAQPADNGRGRFRTDTDGRFTFRTIRPVDYPIPHDGPVGQLLARAGRHPWRPAHIHVIASAPGYQPVTTHMFDAQSKYLDSDAVFGVKASLVRDFEAHDPALEPAPDGIDGRWYTVDLTIALEPTTAG